MCPRSIGARSYYQRTHFQRNTDSVISIMAGNQHVLQNEHALAQSLATSTAWRRNMRSVDGWQIRASPPRAIFFRFSQNSEKSQFFLKKIDFFKYFLIFFSKILNLGSPNTPFRTSTVDRKKLQFLRSENIHKKEKHAATYDVVRARPSCI